MLDDGPRIYQAILDEPDNDLHRLKYADWLEENDQDERAKQIRHQIGFRWNGEIVRWTADALKPAERGFYSLHGVPLGCVIFRRGFVAEVRLPIAAFLGGPCEACDGDGARRLVRQTIRCLNKCHGGQLPGLAADLFAAHPIERVVPTDKRPLPSDGRTASWWYELVGRLPGIDPESGIPLDVWNLLTGYTGQTSGRNKTYASNDAAVAALSDVLCQIGRGRARSRTHKLRML